MTSHRSTRRPTRPAALVARALLLLAGLVPAARAAAQDGPPRISTTEGQLLATFGQGEQDPYWVLTLQHFSTWRHGSNFFFLDLADEPGLDFFQEQPALYLEYAPVVSLGSLGVGPAGQGPLRDVGLTAQINAGWATSPEGAAGGFPIARVFLEGVELAWSVPGFAVFNTQLLARQERGYDPTWQLTWVYALPLSLGPARGEVTGFLDVWRRTGEGRAGSTVVLAQPQLLLNLGEPRPGRSFLQAGVELEPSRDFPAREVNAGWNLAVSPMLRWVF